MNKHPGTKSITAIFAVIAAFLLSACTTAPKTELDRTRLEEDAMATIALAQQNDPSLKAWVTSSTGYAVFPRITKGAVGVGGAYGKGVLFENGVVVGYCDLTQATIGFQLGGQAYSEIIFFETPAAIDAFKRNRFQLGAQATAVALKSGVGTNAKYADGVAVFTMSESGLMYEAAIGGQKFGFEPR